VQIIFSAIPVWSALIGYFALGEAPLQMQGMVGACLIIAAGLTIALEASD
jgi:drug/metabolite transporter (DMT)-like permease